MQVSLTVSQVLQTEGFKNSIVLAGKSGLHRQVTKITVAELPDTLNWLQGGELICSTVYYLKDNPEAQKDWIIGMAEHDVAALAIKPQRFIGQVPQIMIALAEQYQFPLIELPLTVTWPSVIGGVMHSMLDIQTKRLRQFFEVHEKLTKLVLTSKGLNTIVKTIANLVENPVILEDRSFSLLAQGLPSGTSQIEAIKTRLSKETIERLKHHSYFSKDMGKGKKFLREPITTENGTIEQLILPVTAGNNLFGWLTTLFVHRAEEPLDRIALEHGSTVLALELLKEKASLEALARAKTDFLRGMLEDNYVSDHELQKKANLLGIDLTLPTIVLIVNLELEISLRTYLKLEDLVIFKDVYAALIRRTQDMVIFFHPKNHTEQETALAEASNLAASLVSSLKNDGYECSIGIGRCYQGIREIKKSYYEAKRAVLAAGNIGRTVLVFPELGLYRLLSLVPDHTELMSFCQDTLGKLVNYDEKHKTSLLDTLRCYLKSSCNQTETARELHLHVNSLSYRLQRIEEILGVNLADAEIRLLLHLATKILQDFNHLEDLSTMIRQQ